MIDLHTHILPGVDDGARDLDEAIRMCHMAAAEGCQVLIATPHRRHTRFPSPPRQTLEAILEELRQGVGDEPELRLGGETLIDSHILEEVDRLPDGEIVPLADSRYLLLEFDRGGGGPEPEGLIHELTVAGWFPILAHPELIPHLGEDLELVRRLHDLGAHFQVTAMSVSGDFGPRPRLVTHRLLDAGLVDFVASDSHGVSWRPPGLTRAYDVLRQKWGEERARCLTTSNPRAVLDDLALKNRRP